MKRVETHPEFGPLVAMACRCSVYPIATAGKFGRCKACGVRPRLIPDYNDLADAR